MVIARRYSVRVNTPSSSAQSTTRHLIAAHTVHASPKHDRRECGHLPANVSMPGVDACLKTGCGEAMRASWGDPSGCGVFIALWIALAPFAMWAKPGDGICWSAACGCGEEVICWLSPDGVRDGIWRIARLLGDCSIEGDGRAGGGWGVGVPAGESDGDSSELMSMLTVCASSSCSRALWSKSRRSGSHFRRVLGAFEISQGLFLGDRELQIQGLRVSTSSKRMAWDEQREARYTKSVATTRRTRKEGERVGYRVRRMVGDERSRWV